MSVNWTLSLADPIGHVALEGKEFDPHGYTPEHIDLLLVGNMHGPIGEAFMDCVELSHEGNCYTVLMATDVVRRFSQCLEAIPRSDFTSQQVLMRDPICNVGCEHEQFFYDDLIAVAEKLRRFVADAATRRLAILLEVC